LQYPLLHKCAAPEAAQAEPAQEPAQATE
jgi:hypothetical protein